MSLITTLSAAHATGSLDDLTADELIDYVLVLDELAAVAD